MKTNLKKELNELLHGKPRKSIKLFNAEKKLLHEFSNEVGNLEIICPDEETAQLLHEFLNEKQP